MVHAFIMVKTAAGKSEELLDSIRSLGAVGEAHIVAGNFDIITEVDTEEVYDVLHTVVGELQKLDGIADTKTYICLQ
ncbi:Lrp/AsnC ligand binding domain-containing protein [Haloarchaeobius amylolyticus]|uniref:Lrp/AsnC ligand binding domain-containing protein n=1 Tax=Haloarchaeobius amylolyticus TaxID=1198296 RepID=UPI0022714B18|nr:Lrp/AsnC ligand binding domain-containing protein [Haloarchaeobius amylolyticus]